MPAAFSISSLIADTIRPFHFQFFSRPRLAVLSKALSQFIPAGENQALDIGCGSGELAKEITLLCPSTHFSGVDVLPRLSSTAQNYIHFQKYDGTNLPFADKSFSFSMLIDVLHHTNTPKHLLSEVTRVSRDFILVKDHICQSNLDRLTLSFMDWIGNKSYGVHLPYNYLSNADWQKLFAETELEIEQKTTEIGLYKMPIAAIFERQLHFIAKLKIKK